MKKTVFSVAMLLAMVGCQTASKQEQKIVQFTSELHVAYRTLVMGDNDTICFGGYGSSISFDSKDSSFYLLTDRGPNVDGKTPESKMFPFPEFSPTIGRFRPSGDSLLLVEDIILKQQDGTPFLGLPNREGDGVNGEVAYDFDGKIITSSYRGLDTEGLTRCKDGSFWVSDEYAPFMLHFAKDGTLIKELSPENGLPSHFAKRRPNRGMEGVTISKDEKKLYGIMQSPLYIPDSRTKNVSRNIRILEVDLLSGATREFIYQLENAKLMVSDISFVNDSTLLVLERDGQFATDSSGVKMVYRVNLANATDVSDKEIEMLSDEELSSSGILPVEKSVAVDIIKAIPGYSHDKAEGITLINNSCLAIVNDDDFSCYETKDGGLKPKHNLQGGVDHAVVYFVEIKK